MWSAAEDLSFRHQIFPDVLCSRQQSPFFENSSKVFWHAVTCDVAFQGMIRGAPWPAELRVDWGRRWTPTSGLGERQTRLRDTSHLFQMTGGRQCVIKSLPLSSVSPYSLPEECSGSSPPLPPALSQTLDSVSKLRVFHNSPISSINNC